MKTIQEIRFMESVEQSLRKIAKELERLNNNLEKKNEKSKDTPGN